LNKRFVIALALILLVFSCGIEEYIYLDPVENVETTLAQSANIIIPDNSSNPYFRYYTIFYRIYLSDRDLPSVINDSLRIEINPTLASHYNTLDPYTTTDSVSPNAIESVFRNLHYYPLYVSPDKVVTNEIAMHQLLSKSTSASFPFAYQPIDYGDIVSLDFTNNADNDGPYMTISYAPSFPLYLFRSREGFTPRPDRLFFNSADLNNASFITAEANIDVERKTNFNPAFLTTRAYVSMYILATGIDNNYTLVYSRPKHIGIFRLP
jgi:hypothetical protein